MLPDMSDTPDDPELRKFLASQTPPAPDRDAPEMQRLFDHTRNAPPRTYRLDAFAKAGIGVFVILIILRILIKFFLN
ncbi:MAG TPA: hypothetical protein VFV87_16190 [Pirellulaceae bacterium]|nr:hypothetical protein [Pirellulaceae bacterium]